MARLVSICSCGAEPIRRGLHYDPASLREAKKLERTRDTGLLLVRGRVLLEAESFLDGIHPDDAGHQRIAQRLGPILVDALAGEGS